MARRRANATHLSRDTYKAELPRAASSRAMRAIRILLRMPAIAQSPDTLHCAHMYYIYSVRLICIYTTIDMVQGGRDDDRIQGIARRSLQLLESLLHRDALLFIL